MPILHLEIAIEGGASDEQLRAATVTRLRALLQLEDATAPVVFTRTLDGSRVYVLDLALLDYESLRDSNGTTRPRRAYDGRSYDDRQLHR